MRHTDRGKPPYACLCCLMFAFALSYIDIQCPKLFACADMTSYALLGATLSLTAVGALLSAQPSRRPTPAPMRITSRVQRHSATSRSRLKNNVNSSGGMFDANVWENITTPNFVDKRPTPVQEGVAHVDVDVDQLPTFVFFADGGRRREYVVGGSNARACWAKLEAKLLSFSLLHRNDFLPTGDETVAAPGIVSDASLDDNVGISLGDRRENSASNSILEVKSREELLHIVTDSAGTIEQRPVVVMYHAPWCRKCAYLAPVFRRLATKHVAASSAAEGDGDGGVAWSRGALFCRVDVSAWGDKAYRSVADSRAGVASLVTRDTLTIEGGANNSAHVREDGNHVQTEEVERRISLLHEGSPSMEECTVCEGSGFVSCGECEGVGAVERSSSDGKHKLAVTCPACVGYKRLRCPACGGQCYMC